MTSNNDVFSSAVPEEELTLQNSWNELARLATTVLRNEFGSLNENNEGQVEEWLAAFADQVRAGLR